MANRITKAARIIAARDDALTLARERVRQIRDEKVSWNGLPLSWFEPADTLRGFREQFKNVAMESPELMHDLVQYARAGWGLGDDILCELELLYGHLRVAKPLALEAYMVDRRRYGRPARVSSAQPYSHFLRDLAIIYIVAEVGARSGMKPTRTSATRPSVSSIVAEALHLEQVSTIDEKAVAGIWNRLGKIAFPGGFHKLRPLLIGVASAGPQLL